MAGETNTRKPRKSIDPNETERDKFVRLATARTGNAIESIRKIALLGNKAQYEYTAEDVQKIKGALQNALDGTVAALESGKPQASAFTL